MGCKQGQVLVPNFSHGVNKSKMYPAKPKVTQGMCHSMVSPDTSKGMKYPNSVILSKQSSNHNNIWSQVKSVTFSQQRGQFRELEVSHSAQVF